MRWHVHTRETARTAAVWIGCVGLALLLWRARAALLLLFGAVLVAILLQALSDALGRILRLAPALRLLVATAAVATVIATGVWLFGSQISAQLGDLTTTVDGAQQNAQKALAQHHLGGVGSSLADRAASMIGGMAKSVLGDALAFAQAVVVIAVTAIYLATNPSIYKEGLAALCGEGGRTRAMQLLAVVGGALKRWLLAQLILMLLVGILSFGALTVIGLHNAAVLAVIAGLSEFIPYLGPFIGAVPALLVAVSGGWTPALWTAVAYLLVHVVEGYVAAPLLQQRFVAIPPALLLVGIVIVGTVFGPSGVLVGAPMTVAFYVTLRFLRSDAGARAT